MISYPNVKVNLGLEVLRKRPDGFHDIETLFVPYFGIYDTLEILAGDDYSKTSASLFARYGEDEVVQGISEDGKLMITIARKGGVDWEPLEDLCAKAYHLLDVRYKLPPVKIFLEKTSPVGAGLGGGSSDAAFSLRMLAEMFGLDRGEEALAGHAASLGSDCAFFIYNRPMSGEGRGEILSPFDLNDIDFGNCTGCGYELKVLVPENIKVSTSEAYKNIVPRETAGIACTSLKDLLNSPVEEWKGHIVNDFETSVFAVHPELKQLKESLYDSGAVYASMSGSGPALFAIYKK